jgi:uncharacterized protein (TIGR02246 family)
MIEDERALLQLAYRYARAVDRRQPDELAALFTLDGLILRAGMPPWQGREAIRGIPARLERLFQSTLHAVHNQIVTVRGDEARGETYSVAYHLGHPKEGKQVRLDWGIRYQDSFTRVDGSWLFSRRELIIDWTETTELPALDPAN